MIKDHFSNASIPPSVISPGVWERPQNTFLNWEDIQISTATVLEGCEIWLAFGHGSKFWYIAAHTIATALGEDYSKDLLFMHALSGCDSVSFFNSIGMKTAWAIARTRTSVSVSCPMSFLRAHLQAWVQ